MDVRKSQFSTFYFDFQLAWEFASIQDKLFHKQDHAFEYADMHKQEELQVFAFETGSKTGGRQYITSNYEEFWRRYPKEVSRKCVLCVASVAHVN